MSLESEIIVDELRDKSILIESHVDFPFSLLFHISIPPPVYRHILVVTDLDYFKVQKLFNLVNSSFNSDINLSDYDIVRIGKTEERGVMEVRAEYSDHVAIIGGVKQILDSIQHENLFVSVLSLSTLIRFGGEGFLEKFYELSAWLTDRKILYSATINPDMLNTHELASIRSMFDVVLELYTEEAYSIFDEVYFAKVLKTLDPNLRHRCYSLKLSESLRFHKV
jgi:hypothetical protein